MAIDYRQLIANITPEIHAGLRRAIEIGRWQDGRRLTDEQRALCMEAVIAYEAEHCEAVERVGYIDRGSKAEGEVCGDHDHAAPGDDVQPLQWQ